MVPVDHEDEDFKALLKPIQDINKNWNINLSMHLEEYMNHIRQITGNDIPVDMNFAEAAVLVQNSASIYSKRVDFLSTDVYLLVHTVTKKQSEAKRSDNPPEVEGAAEQPASKRRKPPGSFDIDEFITTDKIVSDRNLTIDLEKEMQKNKARKKEKIVLNAAIKVKPKENTSCNIYSTEDEILGKKEEFRLNWRICSAGTLHEDYVISKNMFRTLEPVEVSVRENGNATANDSYHDYDGDNSHHSEQADPCLPVEDPLAPLSTSLSSTGPLVRESEDNPLEEKRMRLQPANIVDIKECNWKPNDFNENIPEKDVKKRKVTKIALGLEDENKRKRLPGSPESTILSFTVTDVLFAQYRHTTFARDLDFAFGSKCAVTEKRQMFLRHRAKYQAYMEKEAGAEQVDDFHGFYNDEHDSDNELDFGGFDDVHNDDESPEVDVPLPDKENILDRLKDDGWKGDDMKAYDNEAIRTMQEYQSRKNEAAASKDLAERVKEWHSKILPKIQAAEKRCSFDIHDYGTKVLNSFNEGIGSLKTFKEVVAGETREEVARYLLASLMLANQSNVEISKTEPGELTIDCVQLKLLSLVRHHEELDDNIKQTSDK